MNGRKTIIWAAALSAGTLACIPGSSAQTFQNYQCADGTAFIVGFYAQDPHAYIQIDGQAMTLNRRLAFSGQRYSGGGVTLRVSKAGTTTIRHAGRTAVCQPRVQ
jgi:membrane-bound inhibitor of C-type lysozyme